MTAILARMYEHLRWADEGVYNSLLSATNPPPHSLELFAHLVATEDAWLSRLRGEENKVVPWPHLSLTHCAELAKRNADDFSAFIAGLESSQLDDTVTYRNTSGTEFTSTIGDILTHVALHGAYHRGQIAAAVRSGGDTPAVTDFIAFARGVPAAPRS